MMSKTKDDLKVRLLLQRSDETGWTAEAVVTRADGSEITLEPTAIFATKELAGQAAYDAARIYAESIKKQPRKRT